MPSPDAIAADLITAAGERLKATLDAPPDLAALLAEFTEAHRLAALPRLHLIDVEDARVRFADAAARLAAAWNAHRTAPAPAPFAWAVVVGGKADGDPYLDREPAEAMAETIRAVEKGEGGPVEVVPLYRAPAPAPVEANHPARRGRDRVARGDRQRHADRGAVADGASRRHGARDRRPHREADRRRTRGRDPGSAGGHRGLVGLAERQP